jgi:hypothetical protein
MGKLINFIFSRTPIFKVLDGKKTLIGAGFVIAAAVLETLEKLAALFPQHSWIADAARSTKETLALIASSLESVGLGFLTLGVVHKGVKAKNP